MKLLILTQKVDIDDDILGFFHDWIIELAKYYEKVTVICLQRGRHTLPKNIKVISLGKDEFLRLNKYFGFIRRLVATLRFYNCIIRERKNYDRVLVHMNPEYVVLGGLFWKAWKKKIALWYTHKSVDLKLRLATKLTDIIFTASKESFRLASQKVRIVGHGINIEKFRMKNTDIKSNEKFKIVTAGRISPIKDYETMIKAVYLLRKQGINNVELDIIGDTVLKIQKSYFKALQDMVATTHLVNRVNFLGAIPHYEVSKYLQTSDLFINLSGTGSVDKAVLEAMACGCLVLTSNEAFNNIIPSELMVKKNDPEGLAKKIKEIISRPKEAKIELAQELRQVVVTNHSLNNLIKKITEKFN